MQDNPGMSPGYLPEGINFSRIFPPHSKVLMMQERNLKIMKKTPKHREMKVKVLDEVSHWWSQGLTEEKK